MPARVNGRHPNTRQAIPLVAGEDGKAVPLPPLSELHGSGLPGGDLHRIVTDYDPGFMAPSHVRALAEVSGRPVLDPDAYAATGHRHPALEAAAAAIPPLERRLETLGSAVSAVQSGARAFAVEVQSIAGRPVFRPSDYAAKGHEHPPVPLPAHRHPEVEVEVEAVREEIETVRGAIAALARPMTELGVLVAKLRTDVGFARDLAEKAIESRTAKQAHGQLGGGRNHEACSDRLAGFMTPQILRKIEILWEERGRQDP